MKITHASMQDLAAVAAVEAMCFPPLRKRPRKKTLPVESNTTGTTSG